VIRDQASRRRWIVTALRFAQAITTSSEGELGAVNRSLSKERLRSNK